MTLLINQFPGTDLKHPGKSRSKAPTVTIPKPSSLKYPQKLFDIRLAIMRYANPLKAKILIFSALHHPFSFSEEDWIILKRYSLDDWILGLVKSCKTFAELEAKLYNSVRVSKEPEQSLQVAQTIIQALEFIYVQANQRQ